MVIGAGGEQEDTAGLAAETFGKIQDPANCLRGVVGMKEFESVNLMLNAVVKKAPEPCAPEMVFSQVWAIPAFLVLRTISSGVSVPSENMLCI